MAPEDIPSELTLEEQRAMVARFLDNWMSHPLIQSDPPTRVSDEEFYQLGPKLDIIMASFVGPSKSEYANNEFAVQLLHRVMDLCERVVIRIPALFQDEISRARDWILRLLEFMENMGLTGDSFLEGDNKAPSKELIEVAMKLAVKVVRCVASRSSSSSIPGDSLSTWHGIRFLLSELLGATLALTKLEPHSFPAQVTLLPVIKPRMAEESVALQADGERNIVDSSSAMQLVSLLLRLVIESTSCSPSLPCSPFIADLLLHYHDALFHSTSTLIEAYLLHINVQAPFDVRALTSMAHNFRSVSRLLSISERPQPLLSFQDASTPFPALVSRAISVRIARVPASGPSDALADLDKTLQHTLECIPNSYLPSIYATQIAITLRNSELDDLTSGAELQLAHLYLVKASYSMPISLLHTIIEISSRPENTTDWPLESIHQHLTERLSVVTRSPLMPPPVEKAAPVLGKRKRPVVSSWRERLGSEVQNVILGKTDLQDSGGRGAISDEKEDAWFANEVLQAVERKFRMPLDDSTIPKRLALASSLSQLTDIITERLNPAHSEPHSSSPKQPLRISSFIPAIYMAAARLLAGIPSQITPEVQRHVWHAMENAIRFGDAADPSSSLYSEPESHSSATIKGNQRALIRQVVDRTYHGLSHPDRSVRIAAGKVLVAFAEALSIAGSLGVSTGGRQTSSPLDGHAKVLFDPLHNILTSGASATKETTIITVGKIGRHAQGSLLELVIMALIGEWGEENSVLKSLAFIELKGLSIREKTPYGFLTPYFKPIIKFVTANISTKPIILEELARFVGLNADNILTSTLSHSLPSLIATCSRDELQEMSRYLKTGLPHLLVSQITEIFKELFLLPDDGDMQTALNFLCHFFSEVVGTKGPQPVSAQFLATTCIAGLLGELVICLGDESPNIRKMARKALARVERVMAMPNSQRQRSLPKADIATFLRPYILGIMTHLNEVLQDVKGKQTLANKQRVIRCIGPLTAEIGSTITAIAPQLMAAMQSSIHIEYFTEVTLGSWQTFIRTLRPKEVGPYIGSTCATLVDRWLSFYPESRNLARQIIDHIVLNPHNHFSEYLDQIVSLDGIPELQASCTRLEQHRRQWSKLRMLENILDRSSRENITLARLSLHELKLFLIQYEEFVRKFASGDIYDPIVGQIMHLLFEATAKDGDGADELRLIAYECIGVLGALDPDRLDFPPEVPATAILNNFIEEGEAVNFAIHVIRDLLVDAYRSTSDLRYQSHLAYAIQELLKFCGFTADLVKNPNSSSIPLKVRGRWDTLPTHMLDTITPLLEGRFVHDAQPRSSVEHPIYAHTTSYREWVQNWASHLITRAAGPQAATIFGSFRLAVRSHDVQVARFLVPHLALNILLSGEEQDKNNIRLEIMTILEDQVQGSTQSDDRRILCAQTIFSLMDHLSTWIRSVRQHITKKRTETKKSRAPVNFKELEEHLMQVDSMITSIDSDLMAQAAFNCKAYARALMTLEQHVATRKERKDERSQLQPYYERLHHIYAHLDEPDGMEGISAQVLSPSIEHQIREHESTGRWTSAQSCWELRLQKSPDDIDLHIGLLRCLRHLGHYDTLRTHIKGVITRHPSWEAELAGYLVEGAWMVEDWKAVAEVVSQSDSVTTPEITIGQLLLALRAQNPDSIATALRNARSVLGTPITALGKSSYRRAYDSIINLHNVYELEMIHNSVLNLASRLPSSQGVGRLTTRLKSTLAARLESTLPTFRSREPILSLRRTAFSLNELSQTHFKAEIGRAWLATSKIARKAGHAQTAYTALLQAQQWEAPHSFLQSCKLTRASGDRIRALTELDNALTYPTNHHDMMDLTGDGTAVEDIEDRRFRGKGMLLRARWMLESDRYESNDLVRCFNEASHEVPDWESPYYYFGHYHDICLAEVPRELMHSKGGRSRYQVCKAYSQALKYGSKYIYQTLPRMITVWLDEAENPQLCELDQKRANGKDDMGILQKNQVRINEVIKNAVNSLPVYQWLTAFPQIVSRVGHPNVLAYEILASLMSKVIHEFPQQGLWLFTTVVKSQKPERAKRGEKIIATVQTMPSNEHRDINNLVRQWYALVTQILDLSEFEIPGQLESLNFKKHFPQMLKLLPSSLILPLQGSMIVTLPATSTLKDAHKPFPRPAPRWKSFENDIQVMPSLQKPRKIIVNGDDGIQYTWLCKPKDDLRKDARLMDLNGIMNKILKTDSEARRRQLRIRTYAVMPLNEESGLIEWVNHTVGLRHVLVKLYDARNIPAYMPEFIPILDKVRKAAKDDVGKAEAGRVFLSDILSKYPPVFHEWFLATFPEPTAWLAARLTYARTYAVMCMVGYILGLGDRHGENILFDDQTGDTVHVDLNCLFDKGRTFEIAERVPFRLTQNIVDGFGVTGVEGVYRHAAELTMQILRKNKNSLMSVLEAFVHDPLVEWEHEKKRQEREQRTGRRSKKRTSMVDNDANSSVVIQELAQTALLPIQRKLEGWVMRNKGEERDGGKIKLESTTNQVEKLIEEAGSPRNMGLMYVGWAAWL